MSRVRRRVQGRPLPDINTYIIRIVNGDHARVPAMDRRALVWSSPRQLVDNVYRVLASRRGRVGLTTDERRRWNIKVTQRIHRAIDWMRSVGVPYDKMYIGPGETMQPYSVYRKRINDIVTRERGKEEKEMSRPYLRKHLRYTSKGGGGVSDIVGGYLAFGRRKSRRKSRRRRSKSRRKSRRKSRKRRSRRKSRRRSRRRSR